MTNKVTRRALVWNAHWKTVGGGERYALSVVHSLIKLGYEVLILGNCTNPNSLLLEKFNEDLNPATYHQVSSETEVHNLALESDLFVNASYGSMLPAPISNSYYICHFPEMSRKGKIKSRLLAAKENTAHGLDGMRIFPDRTGKFIATHEVYLKSLKKPEIVINNSGVRIGIREIALDSQSVLDEFAKYQVTLNCPVEILNTNSYGALVENLSPPNLTEMLKNRLYKPNLFFLSYKRVLSNSIFTASWIREYWGIESSLLYPPVKIGFNFSNSFLERQPTKILSVGRFIDPKYGHSKNQLELVRAFRILEKKSDEIFELHLVGGLDKRNNKYFEKVARLSRNRRIFLHPNASSETLDHLYKTSTLFWHATGLNVHDRKPEKMEHFGISVVEAIGNGLLPIVFDSAGPAEILAEFPELRFTNHEDLVKKTLNARTLESAKLNQLFSIPLHYNEESFFLEFRKLISQ